METGKRILIALGGNAIKQAEEKGTPQEQFRNCAITCKLVSEIAKNMGEDDRLILTHGNGPQVGNIMVQEEEAKHVIPAQTLDVVGSMTQGQIGYMLQQTLANYLKDEGILTPVCTVITQVLVNKNDPEFFGEAASKPVGNFFTKEEAMKIKEEHPEYTIQKVRPVGRRTWRRTVPSPDPVSIVENAAIKELVDSGIIVIACGGGGIPVIMDDHGQYKGIEAVIDKDLAGERLAQIVGANVFLILTDVEKVKLNFGKPDEKDIDEMTCEEAKKHLEEGHFLKGSMGPKIKACINFLEGGGEKAIITSLDKAFQAIKGETGTLIYRSIKQRQNME
ncbi:carbamate kinase [Candidatus Bathyarchaeota archaeon]|nr:carbamate kinase [Candidatus Bathyarchaeota archaeon]